MSEDGVGVEAYFLRGEDRLSMWGVVFSFFGEHEGRQTVQRCCIMRYTFGSRSYVLLTISMLKND